MSDLLYPCKCDQCEMITPEDDCFQIISEAQCFYITKSNQIIKCTIWSLNEPVRVCKRTQPLCYCQPIHSQFTVLYGIYIGAVQQINHQVLCSLTEIRNEGAVVHSNCECCPNEICENIANSIASTGLTYLEDLSSMMLTWNIKQCKIGRLLKRLHKALKLIIPKCHK